MDVQQLLNLILRIIGNSKKLPQLSEIYSLNGQDYFLIHSQELGKGVKIAAENALVPVDLIVREPLPVNFPMPGNNNKLYIAEDENGLYIWDQFAGNYKLVAGGEDKHFVFDQATPALVWTVVHNLNKYPSVTVVDSAGTVIETDVVYNDLNTVTIDNGTSEFSGKAYFN